MPTDLPKIQVYLEPELKAEAEKLAKRTERTVSGLVRYLLVKAVEEAKTKKEID